MAIRYRVIRDLSFIHVEMTGPVSPADIVRLIEKISAETGYGDISLHFTDTTGASANWFNLADIRKVATLIGSETGRQRGAVLASDDLIFGLCRQLQAIRGSDTGQVFRTLPEALEHLGLRQLPEVGEWIIVVP